MKIIRHTARDMRQALRAVREQLGEDAVILSSRKTSEGVEVTAAVDFDAATLEGSGFANAPEPLPPRIIDATPVPLEAPVAAPRSSRPAAIAPPVASRSHVQASARNAATQPATRATPGLNATAIALTTGRAPPPPAPVAAAARKAQANTSYHQLAAVDQPEDYDDGVTFTSQAARYAAYEADMISEAAREAVVEHMAGERAPVLAPAPPPTAPARARSAAVAPERFESYEEASDAHQPASDAPSANRAASYAEISAGRPTAPANSNSYTEMAGDRPAVPTKSASYAEMAGDAPDALETDPVEAIREATLTPLASNEVKAAFAEFKATTQAASPAATEAMSDELKTLRRMLENQLAHLAWNDLTRRAPVHTEILRELTEIGISHDLAEHLVRQLPEDQDLTFARRFTIAGLSQYLKVTGDRWLDDGGRVAFVGATGVGKTTTLAKIAVRWVLRHGARDMALVAADPVRIGAHDQLRSLAQLLGVPVYTPENFDQLPALLSRLSERLILIDTPGSSARDAQLAGRLAVLANSASKLETALVLAASTQAGAIEETVRRFAPANPFCCVLTKLDEAASLGGVLSALIRARMPVSYMSEGQRVPEDLRPARALELVSAAVRLAKARGAAADEDLLRRRFGKTAHGLS
jgi:flagellar biosynthesis protein FlhF